MIGSWYALHKTAELPDKYIYLLVSVPFLIVLLFEILPAWYRNSFVSIDDEKNTPQEEILFNAIKNLKNEQNINYEKLQLLLDKAKEIQIINKKETYKSFSSYFDDIKSTFETKASEADKKASKLLDKGIATAIGGFVFLILSIIAWQIFIATYSEIKQQHIYGMVSCSVLFIFIEFISAWFLKQYKSFTDTSTYLLKIKSIFDRYMLYFLAIRELPENQSEKLGKVLTDEIKFPDTYLLKQGDIGFAKEAMETMLYLTQAIKSKVNEEVKEEKQDK